MKVTRLICGAFATNTYLLEIEDSCLLIDPACKIDKLLPYLENKKVIGVLLTHGHFDHIKACDDLYNKYHCPIYLNKLDVELTKDNTQGKCFGLMNVPTISVPTVDIKEGDVNIGPFNFEVIYTPGHSQGSVCYKFKECIFTGDTLFKGSVGRTDLKGGSNSQLKNSLRIFKDMEDLTVYPGHDEISTIRDEQNNNFYLQ